MLATLDSFTIGYVEALVFHVQHEHDDDNNRPYKDKSEKDIAPETWERIKEDCAKFLEENKLYVCPKSNRGGIDFWLTRNREGAGFWDRDWPDKESHFLTESSHRFGEVWAYVGDDGLIYLM